MKIEIFDHRVDQKWQGYWHKTIRAYMDSLPNSVKILLGDMMVVLQEPIYEAEHRLGQHLFFSGGLEPKPFIHLYPKRFQDNAKDDDQLFDLVTTMLEKCVNDLCRQLRALKEIQQLNNQKT
jgi:hypothetical protein